MSAIPPSSNPSGPATSKLAARLTPTGVTNQFGLFLGRGIFSGASANQMIKVPWKPLAPAVLAAGMLMYQRGDEKRKGADPNKKTLKILADLALASFMVTVTAGLYSMVAVIKTLFDMGWQKDAMDKYKSVIQDLGVFTSAYLGLRFGALLTEGATQRDDFRMYAALNKPGVQQWVMAHQGQASSEGQVASHLQLLKNKLIHLSHIKDDSQLAKKFRQSDIEPVRSEIGNILSVDPQLAKQLEQSKDKTIRNFYAIFQHNQSGYVKTARMINAPVYGLLFTTFIGVPLIRMANRWLEIHHPELRGQKVEPFRFPELANSPGALHGPGNAHALEREGHGSGDEHGGEHGDGGHDAEGGGHGFKFPNLGVIG